MRFPPQAVIGGSSPFRESCNVIISCEQEGEKVEAKPILWIVIPCYNEEQVLPLTAPMFLEKIKALSDAGRISKNSRVLFVNDGSKDKTWGIICDLAKHDEHYIGISQSRNRGHQNAVLAGLMEAKDKCDITISIDCDGQDDINAMDKMVDEYLAGCEIVYGVRSKRTTDTWFKRTTAEGFYKLMNWMGAEVVFNHADYRLVSSRVLNHFADFEEVNIFLRGMIPLVGFKSTSVYYERAERLAGESHYPLKKMLALAFNGITSLSVKPISLITGMGMFICFLSLLFAVIAIIQAIIGSAAAGWMTLIFIMLLLGGLQLIALGVVGQYVGKTYLEAKHRPRYIISERTWESSERHWIEEK
ncbi:MAG: glycosyltransferase family 2 protein [Clostridia bacterium]|nr:glycosyltransferase family 2 protein [Clostridia bacterium]